MKKKITLVGGGACALMLGCELDSRRYDISVFDKNAAPGRKFLVAGEGGLNLSHSEDPAAFITRYTPSSFIEPSFAHFSNKDLEKWLNALGIATYVGSSGRLFPKKGIKPIEVLNVLLQKMKSNHVQLYPRHEWLGFTQENNLLFKYANETLEIKSDLVIFCLGGASWPVTGSAGDWIPHFEKKNIRVVPFAASNCSFNIQWPADLIGKAEGQVLKNIQLSCGTASHAGEVVITRAGLEGSGIYPLSPQIRQQLDSRGTAKLFIDLKPSLTEERLLEKLNAKSVKTNFTSHLKTQLNLSDAAVQLLKTVLPKETFLDAEALCRHIKQLPLTITGLGPVEDAISTVGGICLDELDEHFQLKKLPAHYAIGEMLDYDAPTGGYLLQSCFSMGKFVADHFNSI